MYSTDRPKALHSTIACLAEMSLYDQCQKTLVVDGKTDLIPDQWDVIQVPRIKNKFCWGRMWDAGVYSAQHEKIIYLDSDRLLPSSYIQSIADNLKDDMFVYTSNHFMMTTEMSLELCKEFLKSKDMRSAITNSSFNGRIKYEPRHGLPYHGPSKNVMSGSTAFTKKTYMRLGGVDHWYCGHGAYADSDFHMHAATHGCEFLDLEILELHYIHNKINSKKVVLSQKDLNLLSLHNFIYYCHKWSLPICLAENLAAHCKVINPSRYVSKELKQIKEDAMVS